MAFLSLFDVPRLLCVTSLVRLLVRSKPEIVNFPPDLRLLFNSIPPDEFVDVFQKKCVLHAFVCAGCCALALFM